MSIKAILFDLDDTLYDEKLFVISGFKEISKYIGLTYRINKKFFFEDLMNIFEQGFRGNIFNIALENANILYDEKVISKLVEFYRNHKPKIVLDKGVKKILCELRKDYLLGIITDGNFHTQKRKVQALKIENIFNFILYTDEYGREFWKPNIFPFKLALKKLKVKQKEAIYVGDNPKKDFIGANEIGMYTVRLLKKGREYSNLKTPTKDHRANFQIQDLHEIVVVLKRLINDV